MRRHEQVRLEQLSRRLRKTFESPRTARGRKHHPQPFLSACAPVNTLGLPDTVDITPTAHEPRPTDGCTSIDPIRSLRLRVQLSSGFAVDAQGNASFLRLDDARLAKLETRS